MSAPQVEDRHLPATTDATPATTGGAIDVERTAEEAIALVRMAIARMDELVVANPADLDGQARALAVTEVFTRDLNLLKDRIVGLLHPLMETKRVEVAGVGVLEKGWVSSDRWDHDAMWDHVRAIAKETRVVDRETGEAEPMEEAIVRVARMLQSPGQWRKTPLKDRGIDPKELCESTWGKKTVRFVAGGGGR